MEHPMQKLNDLSRSLSPLQTDGTLIAVIEMSLSSWLVAGIVPGVERQLLKKLEVDENALLKLLNRWREGAEKAGLITDLPVGSRTDAIEKLEWYALRWKIEVFHKILKSGCAFQGW